MTLQWLLQIFCFLAIAAAADGMKPKCQTHCGNVSIPYPFGIGHPSCYRNEYFELGCNDSFTPPKPFLGELEILDISILGQMTISSDMGWDCYNRQGNLSSHWSFGIDLREAGHYTFSNTRNKFTALGCDTKAYFTGGSAGGFTTGCISYCTDMASVINGSCTGIGCCQSSIPAGVTKIDVNLGSYRNHTRVWNFSSCSYSFLVDQDWFNFSLSDLGGIYFWNRTKSVPVLLDWVAGKETCQEAQANNATYACLSENSHCYPSTNGPGYRCNCSSGYQGNPYIRGGCEGLPSCYRNHWFKITCSETLTPPKPFWGVIETTDISSLGQMTMISRMGWDCYYEDGNPQSKKTYQINLDESGPYTFLSTRNKLTAVGCDTWAFITFTDSRGREFSSGCSSYCEKATIINGSCTGVGCCQSPIPEGAKRISIKLGSFANHSKVWNSNRCSFSFLVDQDQFSFYSSDLEEIKLWERSESMPVVLDWVAGNETYKEAQANKTTYACLSENSHCYNVSSNGPGYRCNCSSGYRGNPYVKGGCHDIDECQDPSNNLCKEICVNTVGNYTCTSPKGTHGDGRKDGNGCTEDSQLNGETAAGSREFPVLKVTLVISLSLFFLFMATIWTYWVWRKRETIKLKEKFFHQNGGLLLQQKISSHRAESFMIFTANELERATENYNVSRIVGQGGYGVVYKGTLPNNITVAIKKSKIVDTSQIEQFINEIDILSQINHRNVVKLLGCCLEDQVPLLVYEFISNGTLYSHIHETGQTGSISLQNRLRIATETVEALAYLHSSASIPIFHRDVKSSNILLDDNLTAKVSDFGASKLVPIDQTQITTLVQGTLGYLDPEYFQTGQLTAKSDVYSFGVVLVELLTGEKPICPNRSLEERNLAMHFISAMKENRLLLVLQDGILHEGQEALLIAIARLAKRCLKLKGEERPTMKEVAVELQGLRGFQDHPWVNNNTEENESLLGGASHGCTGEASGQYSVENSLLSTLEDGR